MSDVAAAASPLKVTAVSKPLLLLEGLIGSLFLLVGSFGVGWLAPGSPLHRVQAFNELRTSETGVVFSTVLLTLGCWVMFRAWLSARRLLGSGHDQGRWMALALATWSAPQLLCFPIFSRDVFAYIGQGRLVLAGQNPYEQTISMMSNWFQLGTDTTWADSATAYGPLFYWIEAGVVALVGPTNTEAAIVLFRAVSLIGMALCFVYVRKLASLHGVDPDRAVWITCLNPLFIISFVASAHNDSLMVGLALAATYAAAQRRAVFSILLITAAIGVKPIVLLLLPFLGLLLAGREASLGRKILWWGIVGFSTLALLVAMGSVGGYGFGWVSAMFGSAQGATIFSPVGLAEAIVGGLLGVFGIPHDWLLPVLRIGGRLVALLVLLFVVFRGRPEHLVQRLTIGFAAVVVLSPVIQPWYLLWLLPFFAVTGIRADWQTLWVVATVGYFLAWGASDQLFVWQFLEGMELAMRGLSWTVSGLCVLWFVLFDPVSKGLVRESMRGVRRSLRRGRTLARGSA